MIIEKGLCYRLFVGCVITAELRLQLDQSPVWKQARVAKSSQDLVETHFHEKDYIGLLIDKDNANLNELPPIESKILQALNNYCPDFASEKIKVLVFSQVFIS